MQFGEIKNGIMYEGRIGRPIIESNFINKDLVEIKQIDLLNLSNVIDEGLVFAEEDNLLIYKIKSKKITQKSFAIQTDVLSKMDFYHFWIPEMLFVAYGNVSYSDFKCYLIYKDEVLLTNLFRTRDISESELFKQKILTYYPEYIKYNQVCLGGSLVNLYNKFPNTDYATILKNIDLIVNTFLSAMGNTDLTFPGVFNKYCYQLRLLYPEAINYELYDLLLKLFTILEKDVKTPEEYLSFLNEFDKSYESSVSKTDFLKQIITNC